MGISSSKYSEYIVYVDESGDHSLETVNPRFPIFVLAFCVFQKAHYTHTVTPAVRMLKFKTFGHDMVVFHEREIRRRMGHFQFLGKEAREEFLHSLSTIIAQADFTLLPIVIDKRRLKEFHEEITPHVYHLAMRFGLERLYGMLKRSDRSESITHIIFEARGRKEDEELKLEFQQVCNGENSFKKPLPFRLLLADKRTNSEGLQVADMVARPIGLSHLRPEQLNRAIAVLGKKLSQGGQVDSESFVYPQKAKGLKEVLEAQTPVG